MAESELFDNFNISVIMPVFLLKFQDISVLVRPIYKTTLQLHIRLLGFPDVPWITIDEAG